MYIGGIPLTRSRSHVPGLAAFGSFLVTSSFTFTGLTLSDFLGLKKLVLLLLLLTLPFVTAAPAATQSAHG